MPSINQSTADASIDLDGYKSHYATAGAMTVTIEHYIDTSDPSSLFAGLPDDACQCPHWGFVQAGRMAFRYTDEVNGSARDIAGIINDAGNVLGMMPHPERAFEAAHGNRDGRRLFEGLLEAVA